MMKMYKILFFNSLIFGTLITISSYSWFSAWIGLEINLLSFIPLLKNHLNKFPSEATLKYFIVQVMASSFLLFSLIIFFTLNNYITEEFKIMESILTSSPLLMKMGAAPFHFWLPEVMNGLNWNNSFILLTWQKIGPMILISYQIKSYTMFFSIIIILSSLLSGIQGLNQTCMRKIMAYSSINHIGWMLSAMLNSMYTWVYYFIVYCLINLNIVLIMKKYNIFFISQLTNILTFKKKIKFLFMLNFLSLGGLPPFLGFLPKWMTINNMVENNSYLLSSILIISTLISLYFYMRITFSSFTINSEETLIMQFNKLSYLYFMINMLSLTGLILCSLIDSSM